MNKKRRKHSAMFKSKVALVAIKEGLTRSPDSQQISGTHNPNLQVETRCAIGDTSRLQTELTWVKKNLVLTNEEKRKLIDHNHSAISIKRQCELLGLSRSNYYYEALKINAEAEKINSA